MRAMHRWSLLLSGVLTALAISGACALPPTAYRSGPCRVTPRIDGIESPGEWSGAKRYDVDLRMIGKSGEARAVRHAQLLLMNSAANLYVGFRVPDAARDMSLSPLVADLANLVFCRGTELAAGDDRRVVAPGLFADKHFVSPGKDADDAHQDGGGAMRWQRKAAGGEYFIEWQVPMSSGDSEDISAGPGDGLRFNLVYADRFSPTAAETEIGGLFGADTDHNSDWGTLVLASDVTTEAPAPAPEWLARLFPHTGKPDRLAHRLKRLDATEIDISGQMGGSVIVELTYPDVAGRDEVGQARVFLPPVVRKDPTRRVPLIYVAGYDADQAGASGWLAKGYAVCTPHAHPLNPLGRGINLDVAILHAARRLPCVDPLRVSIQGGSAGGWMTLMLTAEAFPLVWAMPDVPPIHWGYNAAYIADNEALAGPAPGSTAARMPVLLQVAVISHQAEALYGVPFDSTAYLAASPLAHLDTITAPVQAVFSTADMLVPVGQVGADLVQPIDRKLFPEGFSSAMTLRFPGVGGARTLLSALPSARYELFRASASPDAARLNLDGSPSGPAKSLVLPYSKQKTWSIVVIDEGAPEPTVGHLKYNWAFDHEPFRVWAEARGVTADQLTQPKLERLMKRMRGEQWRPFQVRPGGQGPEIVGNQLDYPEAERADVLIGLAAFATDDARALRLARLYAQLPSGMKALGPRLGDGAAAGVRAALAARAKSSSGTHGTDKQHSAN